MDHERPKGEWREGLAVPLIKRLMLIAMLREFARRDRERFGIPELDLVQAKESTDEQRR